MGARKSSRPQLGRLFVCLFVFLFDSFNFALILAVQGTHCNARWSQKQGEEN